MPVPVHGLGGRETKPHLEQTQVQRCRGKEEVIFKPDQLSGQFSSRLQLLHQPNRKGRAEAETAVSKQVLWYLRDCTRAG